MLNKLRKTLILLVSILILSLSCNITIAASSTTDEAPRLVSGYTYYIKNKNSGQYLTVSQTNSTGLSTNVLQSKDISNTNTNFEWRLDYMENGEYRIVSMTSTENLMYVLDVYTNDNTNGANIDTYLESNSPDRRWSIQLNSDNCSYRILSKCSNYTKGISVINSSCDNNANVVQYSYSNNPECEWIFEPVYPLSPNLGANYALTNYNSYFYTYPGLLDNSEVGTDCTNFVSQCMLASGVHFQDEWWIWKKNTNYPFPMTIPEFNSSWDVDTIGGFLGYKASSPWISAPKFCDFWSNRVNYQDFTAQEVLENPSKIFSQSYYIGDVISWISSSGNATHTFYISSYGIFNGSRTFMLTYHAVNTQSKSLLEIAEEDPTRIFRFYSINDIYK